MRDRVFSFRADGERPRDSNWPDGVFVDCAVAIYRECVDPTYRLELRPDEINRKTPDVDAVLINEANLRMAIEVTAVQTFASQRSTWSRFVAHLRPIETRLGKALQGYWCILPTHPLTNGFDWRDAARRVGEYIELVADSTDEPGSRRHTVPGVPFEIELAYDPDGILPFQFICADPDPAVMDEHLVSHMEKALLHKRDQLAHLRADGARTCLFLTTTDPNFYRMNWDLAYRAFRTAELNASSSHLSDVLFAFVSDYRDIYCLAFKGDPVFRNALNTAQMRFGPEYEFRPERRDATACSAVIAGGS
jgi:hypothetical protein